MLISVDRLKDGWTRHDETNRHISWLNANAPKIPTLINDSVFPFYGEQYKRNRVFTWSASIFFSILTKSGFSRCYFVKVHTNGRTDMTKLNFMLFVRCMLLHQYIIQHMHSVIHHLFYFRILRFQSFLNWGIEHRLACCLIYLRLKKHRKSTFVSIVPSIPNIAVKVSALRLRVLVKE